MREFGLRAVVMLLCVTVATVARSTDTVSQWQATTLLDAEENYGLLPAGERRVQRAEQRLQWTIGREDGRTQYHAALAHRFVTFRGEVRDARGNEELSSSHNPRLNADLTHAWSETSRLNTAASYVRDTTSSDEYTEAFGLVFGTGKRADKRRDYIDVSVANVWQLTPAWELSARMAAQDLDYQRAADTSLLRYRYWRGVLGTTHSLSAQTRVFAELEWSRFRPDPAATRIQQINAVRSDTAMVMLGAGFDLSEREALTLSIGYRESDYMPFSVDSLAREGRDNGGVLRMLYARELQRGQFALSIDRQLQPSSDGRLLETDELGLSWRHAWSPRWQQRLQALARQERERGTTQASSETQYAELRYGMNVQVQRNHRIGAQWRYRWVDESGRAAADGVGLVLSWTWQPDKQQW